MNKINISLKECIGCGKYTDVCINGVINVIDGKASINSDCTGCGICAAACSLNAISAQRIIKEKLENFDGYR